MNFAAGSLSSLLLIVSFFGSLASAKPALAQPITSAPDGTGTTVTPQGNTFNIQGGSLSSDGANLFHSFQKFGLSSGETANFISNPDIRNILGRVVGGDASYINGLIQVSGGSSNLFLMNPAGILFGPNASLNVPASFTATTATGIGFVSGWFNAVGSNDYNILVGTPSAFNFAVSQPGAIVNEGNLTLTSGNNLTLLGGTVINTGTLTSPGGNITIAAVPGDSAVRISQEGHLLSLDIEPAALTGAEGTPVLQPLSLPQLLTGRPDFGHASVVSVSETGEVSLTGSGVTVPASGGIAAGNIDTSSESGDGGAIALNATSDIITGSLRTAAGGTGTGGDIEIVSSAGGINTSAGALDASSYDGNGGNVTLTAERNIVTGEILSASGEIISLGTDEWDIEQFSYNGGAGTGGNISLESRNGAIDTSAGSLSAYSLERDGGSVTLSASGDIKTGEIRSFSGFYDPNINTWVGTGSGGNIALTSSAGGIDTDLGSSADDPVWPKLDSSSNQGNGGSVTLTAYGDIKIGDIGSSSWGTGSGGNIALNSSAGGIDTANGTVDSSSGEGNGGSVTLTASGDIKTGHIWSSGTGSGGNIALTSRAGGIDTGNAWLSSSSSQGNGGSVTLTAYGDIKTGYISSYSEGTGSGGNIALTSSAGGIANGRLDSYSIQGNGGSVTLTASGDIKIGDIWSSSWGTGSGGNIALTSSAGGIDTADGTLKSYSNEGNGGSVTLTASSTITTGEINASGLLRGGDITITSKLSDILYRGLIDPSAQNGTDGNLTINPYAGSQSAGSFSGLRNITVAGGGNDEPIGANPAASATSDAGKINTVAGKVTLGAHSDITVSQPIKTSSITSLELIAGRSININADIDTSGSNGDIALRANNNSADPKYRESGPGSVTMAPGTALNAGSGNIVIELGRLGQVGDITLSNINTTGALTVNAATGNIRSSSADSLITAGSAFLRTSILDSGGIGLPAEPLRISVTNLEALAGSGGAFFESPELGVTVGGATELPVGILTSGGSDVSLRAAGDITIIESVSTASSLSGNAGNITFNSAAGAINASATLNSSAAQENGGSVTLTASGDIKTRDISSYSNGTGSGGNIALTSSAGGINTGSGKLSSSSSQGNGGSGSVTLTAAGDIKTRDISSYSWGTGSGGNIALNSSAGGIDTTGGQLSSYSSEANGGAVTLTASGDIKTGLVESFSGTGSGGAITLNSSAGGIDTTGGRVSSFSGEGNGGAVTLTASGDLKTDLILSFSKGTGTGGNIALNSRAGGIDTANSRLSSYSSQGNGGSVTLMASGNIKTGQIESMAGFQAEWDTIAREPNFTPAANSTGTGGDITIESIRGGVETSTGSLYTMSSGGAAGNVTINAAGHVETAGIRSDGLLQGGNISIRSDSPNSINVGGNLDTYSDSGTAGDITLSSPGRISLTGDITSYGSTESGDITVTSESNNVQTNSITTQSGTGPSGNITINGNNIAAGNLDSIGSTGAGNVEVRAGNSVTTLNIQSRTVMGNSGNIEVIAPANINTGDQTTSTGDGNSGNITNTAGSDVTAGDQTASSANGNSGNIDNSAGGNVTAGDQTASSANGNSGNIDNSAGSDVTAGNQTASATNGNSGNIANSAGGNVTAGNQTASATNGNSGNITNSAGGNVTAGNQTASAVGGNSGNITNSAGGNVTAGNQTASATNGNSGNITNTAGGNITTGIQTANATGGTAGEITNIAGGSITTGNLPPTGINGSGNSTVTSASGPINTGQLRTETGTVSIQVSSDSSINPNISSRPTSTPDNNNTTFSNSAQQILTSLNVSSNSPLAVNSAEAIAQLEQTREREFANYFGSDISNQLTTTESIR
ncbi:two-partner secretion domain-containing protein, partial [Kamptonema formosum]